MVPALMVNMLVRQKTSTFSHLFCSPSAKYVIKICDPTRAD